LEIDNQVANNSNAGVFLNRPNTFNGTLTLNGSVLFRDVASFGQPTNPVHVATKHSANILMHQVDEPHLFNPIFLHAAGATRFTRSTDGDWYLHGPITGGAYYRQLRFYANDERRIILTNPVQDFYNDAHVMAGADVIVAATNPEGVAWPNTDGIFINTGGANDQLANSLLFAGDATINPSTSLNSINAFTIQIQDINENAGNGNRAAVSTLGQTNFGHGPSTVTFNRYIENFEKDYQSLQLTADQGSRVIFNESIGIAGGAFGFNKVGLGTVQINNAVSTSVNLLEPTPENPINTVNVIEGDLAINSPFDAPFRASKIIVQPGATLSGNGYIHANLELLGNLAPGDLDDKFDSLDFYNDATFAPDASLTLDIGAYYVDNLHIRGDFQLDGDLNLIFDPIFPETPVFPEPGRRYTIIRADNIIGDFSQINGLQLSDTLFLQPQITQTTYSLIIVAIPEPTTATLLLLALTGATRRSQRRVTA
jgi:hypothetical protein